MANRPRSNSMTDAFRLRPGLGIGLREDSPLRLIAAASQRTQTEQKNVEYMASLPRLTDRDIAALQLSDSSCPICIVPFLAILSEEEMATAMDSPAYAAEDLGVTKLESTCGHVFCRKDIQNWLTSGHNSCPTCRRPLMTIAPGASEAPGPLMDFLNATLAGRYQVESLQGRMSNMADQLDRLDSAISLMEGSLELDGDERVDGEPVENHTHDHYDDDRDHLSGMYS